MNINKQLNKGDKMRISMDEDMEERLRNMSTQAGKRRIDWKSDIERMNMALKAENIDSAIIDVYSPPRVNALAELWGLVSWMVVRPNHGGPG